MSNKTPEQKAEAYDKMLEDRKSYNTKRNAKRNILVRKAIELGLDKEITDLELDEEVNRMTSK